MSAKSVSGEVYYLATGTAGEKRLALVEEVYGPDHQRMLGAIGIARGSHVADLGCGTGNTLRWFAAQVGIDGEVVGIDQSIEQLAVARANAEAAGHHNVRLIEASIYETRLPRDAFDVVHARLVLCHLSRPLDALREMAAIAKPGGLVVAFDCDIDGLRSIPPTAAYERTRELFEARTALRGSDPHTGAKLPRLFLDAGLPKPEMALIHPIYLRGEGKRLWEYTLLEGAPFMIEKRLCTSADLDKLAADLAAVAADETIAVAQGSMPVVWARKPLA
jgi:ubiquinone/menaquinone biosynthesis C-methylase UbiE